MIKLRDHYFISWLKVVKEYQTEIIDNVIHVHMTNDQYTEALKEYQSIKPIFKEIRKSVKELAHLTSNSKKEKK